MSFRELSPWEWETAPVALIGRRKMLLTAADGDRFNSMTVGWGGFGVMWGRPVAFYAIRPNRYSFRLAESGERITLSVLRTAHEGALAYCGTHSGRDGEKYTAAGITPIRMPCGEIGFEEAELVIVGRKLFAHSIHPEEFSDRELLKRWYTEEPYHTLYIAEVEQIYRAE